MELDLSARTALVCGSTQGIGRACARQLAAQGAHIVILARDEDKLRDEITELNAINGLKNDYLVADFADYKAVKTAVEHYVKTRSAIHILVNNNGGPPAGKITEATPEAFFSAFTQHLICNQVITQAIIEGMINADYGRIINIISTSVKAPLHGLGVSNTIRASVANWSKTLANEVGKYGITVNNVLPGATKTGRLEQIIRNKAERTHQTLADVESEMLQEIPLDRFALPEEIANAVGFLASSAAAYITGINLPVDGGRTASL